MIVTLTPKSGRKYRVWLDELPDLRYEVVQLLDTSLEVGPSMHTTPRCVAVEARIIMGPRDLYGALGASLVPNRSGQITIQVAVSDNRGRLYEDTLASKLETVYVGLPQEYVDGLFLGIADLPELRSLGAGTLCFDRAAHGDIGSCRRIYEQLTKSIVRLLACDWETVTEEELLLILQRQD